MENILISVIVPVYNVEAWLPRCIDSILNQTYTNLEVLLVDDGSRDASGQICDDYARRDSRIRVFHKENGGQSSARNLALDVAMALSAQKVKVNNLLARSQPDGYALITLELSVKDKGELTGVINKLSGISGVFLVKRVGA